MIVTEVRELTKQKVQIYIEGEPAFVLYKGEAARYSIEQGKPLTEEGYREIVETVLVKRAKLRAMHLLQKMDRTQAEIQKKLERGGYPAGAIEAAISYVKSFGYVNDARYASSYAESQKEKKGRNRIRMELLQKGISQELVQQALDSLEETTDSRQVIRELLEKKRKGNVRPDEKEKQRLYGFFMRKGFSSSDILAVLREAEREDF